MSSSSSNTRPSTVAPGTASCSRLSERRNVDFPQPDGPMMAVTLLGSMVSETSSTADTSRYPQLRFMVSMRSAMSPRSVGAGEQPGRQIQDDDEGDEDEGACPRPLNGDVEGTAGLVEHED